MAKRTSLGANIKPATDKAKAVEVAKKLAGQATPAERPASVSPNEQEYETVSYNLPLDLIDLYRDLADERHRVDQEAKRMLRREIRAAKKAGVQPPAEMPNQARRSASAVVREAMEAYRKKVEAELRELRG